MYASRSAMSLLAVFLCSVAASSYGIAAPFTVLQNYTNVPMPTLPSIPPTSTGYGAAVINESGNVAFMAYKIPTFSGDYAQKVFLGSGATLTEVVEVTGQKAFSAFGSSYGNRVWQNPSINNANQVAYTVVTGDNSPTGATPKLVLWDSGNATVVQSDAALNQSSRTSQSLMDDGTIVYYSNPSGTLVINDHGSITQSPTLPGMQYAVTNANGEVVAYSSLGVDRGLYALTSNGTAFTEISGAFPPAANSLNFTINDLGQVAYVDNSSPAANGDIYMTDASGNPTLRFDFPYPEGLGGSIALNIDGDLAFAVDHIGGGDASGRSLYYLPVGEANPVEILMPGSSFLGDTLADVYVAAGGLNDYGQVAVTYRLTNGQEGVAVLHVVPESSTIAIVAFASLVVLCFNVRRWTYRTVAV